MFLNSICMFNNIQILSIQREIIFLMVNIFQSNITIIRFTVSCIIDSGRGRENVVRLEECRFYGDGYDCGVEPSGLTCHQYRMLALPKFVAPWQHTGIQLVLIRFFKDI